MSFQTYQKQIQKNLHNQHHYYDSQCWDNPNYNFQIKNQISQSYQNQLYNIQCLKDSNIRFFDQENHCQYEKRSFNNEQQWGNNERQYNENQNQNEKIWFFNANKNSNTKSQKDLIWVGTYNQFNNQNTSNHMINLKDQDYKNQFKPTNVFQSICDNQQYFPQKMEVQNQNQEKQIKKYQNEQFSQSIYNSKYESNCRYNISHYLNSQYQFNKQQVPSKLSVNIGSLMKQLCKTGTNSNNNKNKNQNFNNRENSNDRETFNNNMEKHQVITKIQREPSKIDQWIRVVRKVGSSIISDFGQLKASDIPHLRIKDIGWSNDPNTIKTEYSWYIQDVFFEHSVKDVPPLNQVIADLFNGKTPSGTYWTKNYAKGHLHYKGIIKTFGNFSRFWKGSDWQKYVQINSYCSVRTGGSNKHEGQFVHTSCNGYSQRQHSITSLIRWDNTRVFWIRCVN